MDGTSTLTTIDVAAVEETAKKGALRFVVVFVGAILSYWIGLGNIAVTGLWGAISNQWDTAAGTALVAAIISMGGGFLIGQVKTARAKRVAARI